MPPSRSTVGRAIRILELAAQRERAFSAADVAPAAGLPAAAVRRLLATLEQEGVLLRAPGNRTYVIAPRLQAIGLAALRNSAARGARHAILEALVADLGETCNFTMLDGTRVCYLDRVESHWPLRLHLSPGSRVPLHCTASGKLFLASMPKRTMRMLIREAPLERCTPRTLADPARLEAEIERLRKRGIGIDDEEFITGLVAVAVPVRDARKRVLGAVAVHAPTVRLDITRALAHLPRLRRAADAIARTFRN
jgi:IclR family acetate operon transcriptional repressor